MALELGANVRGSGAEFRVWAPRCERIELEIGRGADGKRERHAMTRDGRGFFAAFVEGARAGDRYHYVIGGDRRRPDPVSRFLPEGVHGRTEIVDPSSFRWTDASWRGLAPEDLVFYEIHTGTFTPEGTFAAAAAKIPYLKNLGVTCLELCPVAAFPGARNWGYDGVSHYAVQASYGGPDELKKLVNACHKAGIAVCMDVVYNHFGPEGNYTGEYGHYTTGKYRTPWGEAVNYDDMHSDEVRRYVIENAKYWVEEYHIDALRLDAVHAICDFSAKNILEEIQDEVQALAKRLKRRVQVIAESDLNDSRVIRSKKEGGFGLDGQWSDDFHHALHAVLTGESSGYYEDFGSVGQLAKAIRAAYVYDGAYSKHRGRRHGNSAAGLPGSRFTIATQNHDQVGNRALGDRFGTLVSFEQDKLASAILLLSPYVPLLFMGQEYRETNPFLYFVDHGDAGLVEAVRKGRTAEFAAFGWKSIPDPGAQKTFDDSKLDWNKTESAEGRQMLALYRDLLALRRSPFFKGAVARSDRRVYFDEANRRLAVEYRGSKGRFGFVASFAAEAARAANPFSRGRIDAVLTTSAAKYGGRAASPAPKDKNKDIMLQPFSLVAGPIR